MKDIENNEERHEYTPSFIDYKDVQYLKKFTNSHARIQSKKRTHISAARQREVSKAIKRARFMALMPFIQR